jgi:hypothetical protein
VGEQTIMIIIIIMITYRRLIELSYFSILDPTETWFCSVTLNNGIVLGTTNLKDAQGALGIGSRSNHQMIIPMKGAKAKDPRALGLPLSWNGGSMCCWPWGTMMWFQQRCSKIGPAIEAAN